jgi:hypothetical protein
VTVPESPEVANQPAYDAARRTLERMAEDAGVPLGEVLPEWAETEPASMDARLID